ncbi:RNA-dependent ATPase [Rachicladosporium monterosium]|uniref:RNA-dependent ATPase n=1 Tax=Rachicladosporium monterosium TaxID=1507873 RepID=A0ABR0LE77_9PEZI|nr:RNA-dependent ATPase [Rachicladosporium monterosium]
MSKRSHDDAAASGDPKEARREAKRLKKEKKAQKTEPSDGDVAVPAQLDAVVSEKQPTSTDEILSKDERKALRRAQKQAARAPEAREVARPATGTLGDQEAAAKAERKAVKLAEKSTRKVAKPSEHVNGQTSGEITAGDKHGAGISGRENVDESAYREDTGLAALPQSDIDAFVADNHLAIEDPHKQAYRPIIDFKYLPGDATQRAPFANFSAPTPIQAACWPYLFAGRDVIGVAETGSGKTLAFGLPCVRYIASLPKSMRSGVKACMVSPTRELAMQIHEQLVKLAEPAGVKVVCVYGGMSKDEQRRTLKGAHVVVATPGRLNDFLQEGAIDLSGATYVVLDEADRLRRGGAQDHLDNGANW